MLFVVSEFFTISCATTIVSHCMIRWFSRAANVSCNCALRKERETRSYYTPYTSICKILIEILEEDRRSIKPTRNKRKKEKNLRKPYPDFAAAGRSGVFKYEIRKEVPKQSQSLRLLFICQFMPRVNVSHTIATTNVHFSKMQRNIMGR